MSNRNNKVIDTILKLRSKIESHDYLYHVLDKPEVSDREYDRLYEQLINLEEENPDLKSINSPTQRVGGKPLEHFEKISHTLPMLSLQNSYSIEDIFDFDEKVKKFLNVSTDIEYFCEPKLDGLAVELVYVNGELTRALTRGDGSVGENILSNIKTIKSIPLALDKTQVPSLFEVRGEALIFKNDFLELNNIQVENGEDPYANPRNVAAGSLRQLDPKITAERNIKFFSYALGTLENNKIKTQSELIKFFNELRLPTVAHINKSLFEVCKNATQASEYYKKIEKLKNELPFEIDGVVIKVNNFHLQAELGVVAKSPRWATAAKYEPEQAQTQIENIIIQVGRTGALTPVAVMTPVLVGGVTVTHATLHNQDEITKKDIRIGDTVIVQRAGEVIPMVVQVVLEKRKKNSLPFFMPTHCPSCRQESKKEDGEVILRCLNPICKSKLLESLKHFVSKKAFNIDSLGDKQIEQFLNSGLIQKFSDIFNLTYDELIELPRQGEKSTRNILESINQSKKISLSKFIYSLGLRFIGEQTAKNLAQKFSTLERFLNAKEEELLEVEEIGPKVLNEIKKALENKFLIKEIKNLINSGVVIDCTGNKKLNPDIQNKTFVITGTHPVSREKIVSLIEENGGKNSSSVTSKTDYLILGEESGSKLEKAKKLNIKIISWLEFEKFLK